MSKYEFETNEDTSEVLKLLKEKLSSLDVPSVKAILVFGSLARGELRTKSDVDLLVLHEGFEIDDPVKRRRSLYKLLKKAIGKSFEDLTVIDMELKLFLEPKEVNSLLLNMYWDALVVYDKTGIIDGFLELVRSKIVEKGLKRVKDGKAYRWILPEPMKEIRIL